ncbi:hypothetical protein HUG10_10345 [Halorarum halophilum]|uniref:Uncharacterized protein n=1 Tax=Halorarum halophilum TaxID=2743090 RepID=A0A7D5GF36_9EURY|nr:hypothetical protein [Halobaculum halophilum]QLG27928.1 hypothetical protein HUG10_10345 [Halobaculum halophilum]
MSVHDPRSDSVRVTAGSQSQPPSRHDLLLAAIPTLILLGFLLDHVGALPFARGAVVGPGLAAMLVGYALFVEAPGGPRAPPEN